MLIRYLIFLLLTVPFYVQAETPQPSYMPPPSIASTEGMLKMVAGLLLVLAIIGAIAWALRRFAFHPSAASGAIKIIASVAVGQRERIVLVEVENTRLVLGVAPGRINTLHCIDRSSTKLSNHTLPESNSSKFQEQLNQSI
jgi:flagellar protein FliO/FliZ